MSFKSQLHRHYQRGGNAETLPYELKLKVLQEVNDFKTLKEICSSSRKYNDVCRQNKDLLIASVLYNKYGKNALSQYKGESVKVIKYLVDASEDESEGKKKFKYAVVHWFNYRKDLSAGFLKGFDDLNKAKEYAYKLAEQDGEEVITEDEITDNNGPGKDDSPYANHTIVGYGGSADGYSTTFYCVVRWFDGVTNEWNDFEESEYWESKYGNKWYPEYTY